MTTLTEAAVEAAALDWLASLGWGVAHGAGASAGVGELQLGGETHEMARLHIQ